MTIPINGSLDLLTINKIVNLADPTSAQDAATRAYVLANAGGGTPTEIPDLATLSAKAAGDLLLIIDVSDTTDDPTGTPKEVTVATLLGTPRTDNASVSTPGAGFATDTYLAGSSCVIPAGGLQAKTMYRCRFSVSKTNAGTATPIIQVRLGTAGTTADTSRCTLTHAAQTAVVDEGFFEILCTFRTVGSGTSAVLQAMSVLTHRLSITGLSTDVSGMKLSTSAGFDSTTPTFIGLSVNGGTSAAWTIALVQAELWNLAS